MKFETKNVIGVFKKNNQKVFIQEDIIKFACEFWSNAIINAGTNQINYEMNHEILPINPKKIQKFKKNFINCVSQSFSKEVGYITLWTSTGKVYNQIGIEPLLRDIVRLSELDPKILPSDVCIWIYPNRVEIENNFQHEIIYAVDQNKTLTL